MRNSIPLRIQLLFQAINLSLVLLLLKFVCALCVYIKSREADQADAEDEGRRETGKAFR
jgi:hypothetical protein